ncbi:DNA cytosine methyltransferase [Paratractidigestivibacter sp.]|uniref:DNA cytosine methyltransferase n=1 Tax=Paratractidigestivibacter sp. TaxID=2847316 RepID=UPI002ACB0BC4|nr:DNA cytosine methyltransferase [Paratractidigestivibacter sp.]
MPKFVSLYSGAGGLDLGFIAAGFEPIFANDINADATATYKAAMEIISKRKGLSCTHEVVTGDIRQVETLPAKGSADLVIGGPPCQGFSVAGKMDPNDPRSRHVFDFLGMVERVQPRAFVMENVKALAENKRWAGTIADIRKKAEEIGYKTNLKVLNSADYGVPQARERMFLVGFKGEDVVYEYPEPSVSTPVTVAEALHRLPPIGAPGNDEVCTAKITPAKTPILRQSPFAGMLFNGQGRPMDVNRPAPTLPATMGGNRTPIVDQNTLENSSEQWVVGYHASLMAGGAVTAFVPSNLRRISVQEAAAIQTFPSDMPWQGSQSSRYRQIGNAVPPKMAFAVAKSVAEALGIEHKTDASILDCLQ